MKNAIVCRSLCCCALGATVAAVAMTPAQLRQKLADGELVTVVDVRSTVVFKQGHIPNAINVPTQLVAQKALPPLGRVVVYDDGLGEDKATPAVAALNHKSGITAEVLEGGFAAWESSKADTTRQAGLGPEEVPYITYQALKKTRAEEMVLVDLRKRAAPSLKSPVVPVAGPLTDLSTEFPGAKVVRTPFASAPGKAAASGGKTPLLVLIDSGDGVAQETARALKANGIKRFVVLAGGEEILARKGEPGLQRVGANFVVHQPTASSMTATNR